MSVSRVEPYSLRERVWRLLRIRRKLSVAEAVALLCDGEDDAQTIKSATGVAQRYLRLLFLAGYVAHMQPVTGAHRIKRYLLMRDTGPLAPRYQYRAVFDPNEGIHYAILA